MFGKLNSNQKKAVKIVTVSALCGVIVISTFVRGGGTLLINNKYTNNNNVEIIELDTVDSLRAISVAEFTARDNVLYKVGVDYYSYFPSTGKLELITSVHNYDTMSLALVESMLGEVQGVDVTNITEISESIDNVSKLNAAISDRMQYIQKELDNCNANILLTNNVDLLSYKSKLETELNQLVAYQAVSSEQLQLMLQFLGSSEAEKMLAEKISEILDKEFVQLITEYNNYTDIINAADVKKMLDVQSNVITALSKKYTDIDTLLVEKVNLFNNINNEYVIGDLSDVINQSKAIVTTYFETYNTQVAELTQKFDVLRELYMTLGVYDVDGTNGTDIDPNILAEIRQKYVALQNDQSSILQRIKYLEGVLDKSNVNVASNTFTENKVINTATDTGNVSNVLKEELQNQRAKANAIDDLLKNVDFDNINILADEQIKLQNTIAEIENVLKASDALISKEQTDALKLMQDAIADLLSEREGTLTANTSAELTDILNKLTENIDILSNNTTTVIDSLKELLNGYSGTFEEDNTEITTRLADLTESLAEEIDKQEQQRYDFDQSVLVLLEMLEQQETALRNQFEEYILEEIKRINNELSEKYTITQDERNKLQNTLIELENVLKASDALVSKKQTEALKTAQAAILNLLSVSAEDITVDISADLTEILNKLTENIDTLSNNIVFAIDNLKELLHSNSVSFEADNTELRGKVVALTVNLADEIDKQEMQRDTYEQYVHEMLVELDRQEADLYYQLEEDVLHDLFGTNRDAREKYELTQDALDKLKETSSVGINAVSDDLYASLETLRISNVQSLESLNVEVQNLLAELQNDIVINYNETKETLAKINSKLASLQAVYDTYGKQIEKSESDLVFVSDNVSTNETNMSALSDDVNSLLERIAAIENNPYDLPIAAINKLGGVKVDGRTITVDENGKLRVLIGYETLDSFYLVGSTYAETELVQKPKERIAPYCTKVTETATLVPTKTLNTSVYSDEVQDGTKTQTVYANRTTTCELVDTVKYWKYNTTKTMYGEYVAYFGYNDGVGLLNHKIEGSTTGSVLLTSEECNNPISKYPYWPVTSYSGITLARSTNGHFVPETEYVAEGIYTTTQQSAVGSFYVEVADKSYHTLAKTVYTYNITESYTDINGVLQKKEYTETTELVRKEGTSTDKIAIGTQEVPNMVTKYGYRVTNPYSGVQQDSGLIYATQSAVPQSHTFTYDSKDSTNQPIYDYTYACSLTLDNVQLNKLKEKGFITNTSDKQIYLKELYDQFGANVYIYCGTGSKKLY